jgi:hypothetical protein
MDLHLSTLPEEINLKDLNFSCVLYKPVSGSDPHNKMWVLQDPTLLNYYSFYHQDDMTNTIKLVCFSESYDEGLNIYNNQKLGLFFQNKFNKDEFYCNSNKSVVECAVEHVNMILISILKNNKTNTLTKFDCSYVYYSNNKKWEAIYPTLEQLVEFHNRNSTTANPDYLKFLGSEEFKNMREEWDRTQIASIKCPVP